MSCVLVHFPIILVCDRLDMPGDWLIAHIVGETLYIKYQISILVEYVLMIACAGKGGLTSERSTASYSWDKLVISTHIFVGWTFFKREEA